MPGWIKIHRELMDHWVSGDPASLSVFVRLLCEANFTDRTQNINGSPVTIRRGQLLFGLPAFSKRSGITISTLRRVMKNLQKEGMIDRQNFSKYSIISITNYEEWQADDRQNAGKQQPESRQATTPEEGKKDKKDNNKPNGSSVDEPSERNGYPEDFEQAWKTYPKRRGSNPKRGAYQAWNARIKGGYTADQLTAGLERYRQFVKESAIEGTERVMQAKRFFGPACEFEEFWQTTDCPHADLLALWAEIMPSHIRKPSLDDWTPNIKGYQELDFAWHAFKTQPRQATGKPVFDDKDGGLAFYRQVFEKLAKTDSVSRENAGQFVTIAWAAQKDNTVSIYKGEIQ